MRCVLFGTSADVPAFEKGESCDGVIIIHKYDTSTSILDKPDQAIEAAAYRVRKIQAFSGWL